MDTSVKNMNGKWTLQNILYTITIVITVSGFAVGAYWNIQERLNSQQVELTDIKARLESSEHLMNEVRTALVTISQGISDLRVEQAKRDAELARGRK